MKSVFSQICPSRQVSRLVVDDLHGSLLVNAHESNRLEYLIPKRTSLKHRLPMGDQGFTDFVGHLLEINPIKHLSASEALKHPWLSYLYEPRDDKKIYMCLASTSSVSVNIQHLKNEQQPNENEADATAAEH
ncbi:hypothetical protein YC2023_094544 [Brassica napus]